MTDCLEDAINYLLDQEQFQLAHLLCASHDLEKTQIHSKWTKKLILNGDYDQAAFYNLFFNDINTFVDLSLASGKPHFTDYFNTITNSLWVYDPPWIIHASVGRSISEEQSL